LWHKEKVPYGACRLPVMTMIDVMPQEFFDGRAVPTAVTLDGELLGARPGRGARHALG
jgi:hypothetical protein